MAKLACTGIMLNWKRPDNVYRIIEGWRTSGLSEGIVWNNNSELQLTPHSWARLINASVDLGLYTRFAAACLSQNDCILIQDDDILLPTEAIRQLFEYWQRDPDVLHGIFWRKPKPCGAYAIFGKGNSEAPVILTRALMAHRRYAADFFVHLPYFQEIQKNSRPFGNGEDIIFSYVARLGAAGRLHKAHDLPVIELPAPFGIHHNNLQQHLAHRSNLLKACEEWFLKSYSPSSRLERANVHVSESNGSSNK